MFTAGFSRHRTSQASRQSTTGATRGSRGHSKNEVACGQESTSKLKPSRNPATVARKHSGHLNWHPCEFPSRRWERLHIDFAGPFLGNVFLIIVDAHSKWPEVIPMTTTTAPQTVEVLRSQFARWDLPEQLMSYNGPQFVADVFVKCIKQNGIRHITSAPYHPATNGFSERFVQSFKKSLLGSLSGSDSKLSIRHRLGNLMLAYRNTSHATTCQAPTPLMLGHNSRSRLDIINLIWRS